MTEEIIWFLEKTSWSLVDISSFSEYEIGSSKFNILRRVFGRSSLFVIKLIHWWHNNTRFITFSPPLPSALPISPPPLKLWRRTWYFYFFYKQSVYKQLAFGWQIVKQPSGLNPPFFFLCNKHKIVVQSTLRRNSAVSKALLGKF